MRPWQKALYHLLWLRCRFDSLQCENWISQWSIVESFHRIISSRSVVRWLFWLRSGFQSRSKSSIQWLNNITHSTQSVQHPSYLIFWKITQQLQNSTILTPIGCASTFFTKTSTKTSHCAIAKFVYWMKWNSLHLIIWWKCIIPRRNNILTTAAYGKNYIWLTYHSFSSHNSPSLYLHCWKSYIHHS